MKEGGKKIEKESLWLWMCRLPVEGGKVQQSRQEVAPPLKSSHLEDSSGATHVRLEIRQ